MLKHFLLPFVLLECAIVDDSDNDEDMSDSSYIPEDSADSDEDFTPYKKTKAKRKKPQSGKLQKLHVCDKKVKWIKLRLSMVSIFRNSLLFANSEYNFILLRPF